MEDQENYTILQKITEAFGLTFEILTQLFELIHIVKQSGYGQVTITIKKEQVYNLSYTVEGEPKKLEHKYI